MQLPRQRSVWVSQLFCIPIVFVAILVLWGWLVKNPYIITVFPGSAPMQDTTAGNFLLLTAAVFLIANNRNKLALIPIVVSLMISGATLLEYAADVDLGVDRLFFQDFVLASLREHPGRMAPNTSLSFFVGGLCLLIAGSHHTRASIWMLLSASFLTGIAGVALLGYLLDLGTAYGWGNFNRMAVHTATCFTLLGLSLLTLTYRKMPKEGSALRNWYIASVLLPWVVLTLAFWGAMTAWQNRSIHQAVSQHSSALSSAIVRAVNEQRDVLKNKAERWAQQQGLNRQVWEFDAKGHIEAAPYIAAKEHYLPMTRERWQVFNQSMAREHWRLAPLWWQVDALGSDGTRDIFFEADGAEQDLLLDILAPAVDGDHLKGVFVSRIDFRSLLERVTNQFQDAENFTVQIDIRGRDLDVTMKNKPTAPMAMKFGVAEELELYDYLWHIESFPTEKLLTMRQSNIPRGILVGGLGFGSVLVILVLLYWQNRERNHQLREEITHRKEAEAQLARSKQRLESTLQTMADGVVLADQELMILGFNRAAESMFGYCADEVLGKSVETLMPPSMRPDHHSYLQRYLGGGDPVIVGSSREVDAMRKDGMVFPIDLSIADMEIDGKHYFSALIKDISERRQYELQLQRYNRELERSNEDLNSFAYVASHDLKAPLRGIAQLAGWIREDLEEHLDEDSRKNFDLLEGRTHRLEALLDDLLEYSRAGRKHGDFERLELESWIQGLFAILSPPPSAQLTINLAVKELRTLGVPLEMILRNLLSNAIKHRGDHDDLVVNVSVQTIGSRLQFVVSDNGPGIPEQYQQRIFGLFQTLKPRDVVEGSGMGLAIIRKLLDFYGCSIAVASDGEHGSRFTFDWPLENELAMAIEGQQDSPLTEN